MVEPEIKIARPDEKVVENLRDYLTFLRESADGRATIRRIYKEAKNEAKSGSMKYIRSVFFPELVHGARVPANNALNTVTWPLQTSITIYMPNYRTFGREGGGNYALDDRYNFGFVCDTEPGGSNNQFLYLYQLETRETFKPFPFAMFNGLGNVLEIEPTGVFSQNVNPIAFAGLDTSMTISRYRTVSASFSIVPVVVQDASPTEIIMASDRGMKLNNSYVEAGRSSYFSAELSYPTEILKQLFDLRLDGTDLSYYVPQNARQYSLYGRTYTYLPDGQPGPGEFADGGRWMTPLGDLAAVKVWQLFGPYSTDVAYPSAYGKIEKSLDAVDIGLPFAQSLIEGDFSTMAGGLDILQTSMNKKTQSYLIKHKEHTYRMIAHLFNIEKSGMVDPKHHISKLMLDVMEMSVGAFKAKMDKIKVLPNVFESVSHVLSNVVPVTFIPQAKSRRILNTNRLEDSATQKRFTISEGARMVWLPNPDNLNRMRDMTESLGDQMRDVIWGVIKGHRHGDTLRFECHRNFEGIPHDSFKPLVKIGRAMPDAASIESVQKAIAVNPDIISFPPSQVEVAYEKYKHSFA